MIYKKLKSSTLQYLFKQIITRQLSSITSNSDDIERLVYISQSNDIYTNLALEDWLYRNYNYTNHNIMMLWTNNPCVVIGRHQNPWLEANVANLSRITEEGVLLARRNSGGGTVYHDRGNLNITFFTARNQYNRKHNLELITSAVFRKYGFKINISPREDLLVNEAKVSGTAAKLGQPNAYHHCTLLVNVDKNKLSRALHKEENRIKTNATRSVKSNVLNLCDINSEISIEGLLSAIGNEYSNADNFQMIYPTEQLYPGITKIRDGLKDWEWCYGKTPKFSVTKSFTIPTQFLSNINNDRANLDVTMNVEQGRIRDVILDIPHGLSSTGFSGEAKVITNLTGCKFTEDVINSLEWSFSGSEYGLVDDKDKFVTECVRRVITSV